MNHFQHPDCNTVLMPAEGDEQTVDPLHTARGLLDGVHVVRSYWRPTVHELAALNEGGCVVLTVCGRTHPPLSVGVSDH